MGKDKHELLAHLRRSKAAQSVDDVVAAFEAWGFRPGATKSGLFFVHPTGTTFSMHRPHSKEMRPGAVAQAIRQIEAVKALETKDGQNDD